MTTPGPGHPAWVEGLTRYYINHVGQLTLVGPHSAVDGEAYLVVRWKDLVAACPPQEEQDARGLVDGWADQPPEFRVSRGQRLPPRAEPQFEHLASAMKKVLPPELLTELLDHLDPLPRFLAALREEP